MALNSLKVTELWEQWNLSSHSVQKLHEATQMFMMVGSVGEMTVKKPCKYSEYGSFERLLLLVLCLFGGLLFNLLLFLFFLFFWGGGSFLLLLLLL